MELLVRAEKNVSAVRGFLRCRGHCSGVELVWELLIGDVFECWSGRVLQGLHGLQHLKLPEFCDKS